MAVESEYWDQQAPTFDDQPDHGIRDPAVRAAWTDLLLAALPPAPATVVDIGCGTGSLSVLLAELGYRMTGIDVSAAMIDAARSKADAAGVSVDFKIGDAADPPLIARTFDVVLTRHVLWMFDDPAAVLAGWVRLLASGGSLLLVEGLWFTGVGLSAERCRDLVLRTRRTAEVTQLGSTDELWGGPVGDERYLLVSRF
jgi:SAM-dependent methyltransferase